MPLTIRIFMAVEVTLCYIPGLLLRVFPFVPQLPSKQKKTLSIVYPIYCTTIIRKSKVLLRSVYKKFVQIALHESF